jgi:hypothetical protein
MVIFFRRIGRSPQPLTNVENIESGLLRGRRGCPGRDGDGDDKQDEAEGAEDEAALLAANKSGLVKGLFSPESDDQNGVDVMFTIFCDFRQFSAKKLARSSKPKVMIKILHYLALF